MKGKKGCLFKLSISLTFHKLFASAQMINKEITKSGTNAPIILSFIVIFKRKSHKHSKIIIKIMVNYICETVSCRTCLEMTRLSLQSLSKMLPTEYCKLIALNIDYINPSVRRSSNPRSLDPSNLL